jgi:cbb3-type cytochrome oxidase maturation protein
MSEAAIAQTILTLSILLIFIGFLVWGIRSGQFKNVEEAKYRMLPTDKGNGEPCGLALKEGENKK